MGRLRSFMKQPSLERLYFQKKMGKQINSSFASARLLPDTLAVYGY